MLSASLEDYLEEIYRLSIEKGDIHTSDIAASLDVTLPSVSKALQRLDEDGYIKYQPYQDIILTEKGEELGDYLVKRNQLLQTFFRLVCPECDEIKEAEAVEHYLSRKMIFQIKDLVNYLKDSDYSEAKKRRLSTDGLESKKANFDNDNL